MSLPAWIREEPAHFATAPACTFESLQVAASSPVDFPYEQYLLSSQHIFQPRRELWPCRMVPSMSPQQL